MHCQVNILLSMHKGLLKCHRILGVQYDENAMCVDLFLTVQKRKFGSAFYKAYCESISFMAVFLECAMLYDFLYMGKLLNLSFVLT